eukprot:COSAG02_NODE_891_length_16139_cov_29.045885_3_plen_111_part_00
MTSDRAIVAVDGSIDRWEAGRGGSSRAGHAASEPRAGGAGGRLLEPSLLFSGGSHRKSLLLLGEKSEMRSHKSPKTVGISAKPADPTAAGQRKRRKAPRPDDKEKDMKMS